MRIWELIVGYGEFSNLPENWAIIDASPESKDHPQGPLHITATTWLHGGNLDDARLIAAAPDMLEALEAIAKREQGQDFPALKLVRAAIAKAKLGGGYAEEN